MFSSTFFALCSEMQNLKCYFFLKIIIMVIQDANNNCAFDFDFTRFICELLLIEL